MRPYVLLSASVIVAALSAQTLLGDAANKPVPAPSASQAAYPNPDLLVEPGALASMIDNPQVVVVDARSQSEYDAGHVPGAHWILRAEWAKSIADDQDAASWGKRIGALGIRPDSTVVVYDGGSVVDAARTWWILKYWGVGHVRMLNGCWRGWKDGKFPISTRPTKDSSGTFPAKSIESRLATKSQLIESIKGNQWQIVDARSLGEHCGLDKKNNKRTGAMPGACHLEWVELVDSKSGRFKSPEQLRELFAEKGIDLGRPTAAHCQGGGRSAVMSFAMELMGAPQVRNYYASWGEWGNSDDTPIVVPKVTPPEPKG